MPSLFFVDREPDRRKIKVPIRRQVQCLDQAMIIALQSGLPEYSGSPPRGLLDSVPRIGSVIRTPGFECF
jgi:hypothetical protein